MSDTATPTASYLTQEAYDRLKAELAEREGPRRQEITLRISTARDEGDLKENGGYHAAREEQGKNEARIRQLKQLLEHARIGVPDSEHDEVAPGKVVTVRFPAWDEEETFLLGSREEAAQLVGVPGNTMRARAARARVILASTLTQGDES